MEYNKLTEAQKDYLRELNNTRAALISAVKVIHQSAAEILYSIFDRSTPRESVWNAREDEKVGPVSIQAQLFYARDELSEKIERLATIEKATQARLEYLNKKLRALDPIFWNRLNGSEEQTEPARED